MPDPEHINWFVGHPDYLVVLAKTTDYYPTKTTVLYLILQGGQFEPVSGGQFEMADGGQVPLGNGGQFAWIFQLYIHPAAQGFAIWYTPEQEVDLLFTESLQVNSGKAFVPPLLWKADKNNLTLYALKDWHKPSLKAPLFRAPFFNLYHDNKVCMGTVDKGMENITCLEDFIARWEQCYWNSYFSHMIAGISPVKGNIIQLWQQQVNTGKRFPLNVLVAEGKTIKDLVV